MLKKISYYFNKFLDSKYSEFISYPFYVPIIIWCIIFFILGPIELSNEDITTFYSKYSSTFLGASASIFGISLAALSVFISVIYKPAVPRMIEDNLLEVFLYPFLLNIGMWGTIAAMSIFTLFIDFHPIISIILTYKSFYLNIYMCTLFIAILYTISLAQQVIKFSIISLNGE